MYLYKKLKKMNLNMVCESLKLRKLSEMAAYMLDGWYSTPGKNSNIFQEVLSLGIDWPDVQDPCGCVCNTDLGVKECFCFCMPFISPNKVSVL
jgi:hypothetical protein